MFSAYKALAVKLAESEGYMIYITCKRRYIFSSNIAVIILRINRLSFSNLQYFFKE